MKRRWSDYRLFAREFRRNFHTTGAIAPSGRFLARALTRPLRADSNGRPRRILEVGPGTGAVTDHMVRALGPLDQLDLVEANESFVRRLEERFQQDELFRTVAPRTRIVHQTLESLPGSMQYDYIVSGLPLNNFDVDQVRTILTAFARLLRSEGTLSFFQYIAVRPLRAVVAGRTERQRLRGISSEINGLLATCEVGRDWVLPNLPPAWVHHVRFDATRRIVAPALEPTVG